MNGIKRSLASIVAVGMIAGTMLPAYAVAPSQGVTRVQVGSVPHSIVPSTDFGRRQPGALVTATVMLQYNHPAELASLVDAQSNPSSPLFRHFLTSDQFNSYFAPTAQQQAFVAATLQAAGLRITQTFSNRALLDVQGTSAAAEAFFGTEIHSLTQAEYGPRFANVTPVTVPATIAPFVTSVNLSNLVMARPRPRVASHATLAAAAEPLSSPQWNTQKLCSTGQPENGPLRDSVGHLATGIAKAFDFPVQHGCNGAGRTAAIVIDGPIQTERHQSVHESIRRQANRHIYEHSRQRRQHGRERRGIALSVPVR